MTKNFVPVRMEVRSTVEGENIQEADQISATLTGDREAVLEMLELIIEFNNWQGGKVMGKEVTDEFGNTTSLIDDGEDKGRMH